MRRVLLVLPFVVAACAGDMAAPSESAALRVSTMNAQGDGGSCTIPGKGVVKTGFDEFGYNRCARNFVGLLGGWCAQHGMGWACAGTPWAPYANDRLVMKWNAEWDRGNAEGWKKPPYAAWENNEWNGKVPGGSGEVWHYKIVWVGTGCESEGVPEKCVWGLFETILSQGTVANEHLMAVHATPNGYGSYGK